MKTAICLEVRLPQLNINDSGVIHEVDSIEYAIVMNEASKLPPSKITSDKILDALKTRKPKHH